MKSCSWENRSENTGHKFPADAQPSLLTHNTSSIFRPFTGRSCCVLHVDRCLYKSKRQLICLCSGPAGLLDFPELCIIVRSALRVWYKRKSSVYRCANHITAVLTSRHLHVVCCVLCFVLQQVTEQQYKSVFLPAVTASLQMFTSLATARFWVLDTLCHVYVCALHHWQTHSFI